MTGITEAIRQLEPKELNQRGRPKQRVPNPIQHTTVEEVDTKTKCFTYFYETQQY